jgi:hypothetical protein
MAMLLIGFALGVLVGASSWIIAAIWLEAGCAHSHVNCSISGFEPSQAP